MGNKTLLPVDGVRKTIRTGERQLFDEPNLLALSSPDYPGERLMACRNPKLAKLRANKRDDLLAAAERHLDRLGERVKFDRLRGESAISAQAGKIVNQ